MSIGGGVSRGGGISYIAKQLLEERDIPTKGEISDITWSVEEITTIKANIAASLLEL